MRFFLSMNAPFTNSNLSLPIEPTQTIKQASSSQHASWVMKNTTHLGMLMSRSFKGQLKVIICSASCMHYARSECCVKDIWRSGVMEVHMLLGPSVHSRLILYYNMDMKIESTHKAALTLTTVSHSHINGFVSTKIYKQITENLKLSFFLFLNIFVRSYQS